MDTTKRDEHNPALSGFTMNELIRELSARTNGWSAEAKLGPDGMLIGALREWMGDKTPILEKHTIASFAVAYGQALSKYHIKPEILAKSAARSNVNLFSKV